MYFFSVRWALVRVGSYFVVLSLECSWILCVVLILSGHFLFCRSNFFSGGLPVYSFFVADCGFGPAGLVFSIVLRHPCGAFASDLAEL